MTPALILYNLAAAGAALCLPPAWLGGRLAGRWRHLWPRAGLYRDLAPAPPGPRVWLQAVSLGEVAVARALARELLAAEPRVRITVTSSTATGLARARRSLAGLARVAPFPLDLPWPVLAAAAKIRPHVYASLETELWPNLLAWLDRRGTSLLLLNGRISPRSYPRYRRVRSLVAATLGRFRYLSMISEEDARRVARLLEGGRDRILVGGNAKYAGLVERARPRLLREPAARLGLGSRPLLVAGSVRSGEEEAVLGAFCRVLAQGGQALLAAVPRHPERAPRWLETCSRLGLSARTWSSLEASPPAPGTRVVVVDAMGVLFALYGLARAAFVGASLVPLGGQNPMEPAAWGVPVIHGPSLEDFADAGRALKRAGAAVEVKSAEELAACWLDCLRRPGPWQARGRAGRELAARDSGAAARSARLIIKELQSKGVL